MSKARVFAEASPVTRRHFPGWRGLQPEILGLRKGAALWELLQIQFEVLDRLVKPSELILSNRAAENDVLEVGRLRMFCDVFAEFGDGSSNALLRLIRRRHRCGLCGEDLRDKPVGGLLNLGRKRRPEAAFARIFRAGQTAPENSNRTPVEVGRTR